MYAEPFDPEAPFNAETASDTEFKNWMDNVNSWAEENDKEDFQIDTRAFIGYWGFSVNFIRLESDRMGIDFETKQGPVRQIHRCWYSVRAVIHWQSITQAQ